MVGRLTSTKLTATDHWVSGRGGREAAVGVVEVGVLGVDALCYDMELWKLCYGRSLGLLFFPAVGI